MGPFTKDSVTPVLAFLPEIRVYVLSGKMGFIMLVGRRTRKDLGGGVC